MNFEEFKKRYIAKLEKAGVAIPEAGDKDYYAFEDRMAEIYLGLMVYAEFQNEHAREQMKKQQRAAKIHVPNRGIIQ